MQKKPSPRSCVAAYWRKPPIRLPRCLSPVGWMPEKILIVRSILLREGTKKASCEAGSGAKRLLRRLRAHAPASPRGASTQLRYETVTIRYMIPRRSACAASIAFHNVQAECSSASPISSFAAAAGSSSRWILLFVFGFFTTSKTRRPLVRVVLDPGLLGLRGEPARAEDLRQRRAGAARRRLPARTATSRSSRGSSRRSRRAAAVNPGSRTSSYFTTGSDVYVSKDRHTTFAEIYPPGHARVRLDVHIKKVRAAIREAAPPGVTVNVTGRDPLQEDIGGSGGPSVAIEILIGGVGALLVLLFVFGTLTAVECPARDGGGRRS